MPEVPDEPISKPGDLYLLGEHRLLCGDATSADDVERLMAGKRATLMATDPPYLVDYQGGQHPASEANQGAASKDKHWDDYIDHAHSVEFYVDFLRTALDCALDDHAAIYQWFGIMRTEVIWQSWREVGLLPHQVLIWKKSQERAHLLALHVGLRADDVRLARRQHAEAEAAGGLKSGLGDREQDRGCARLHPSDDEAGGDDPAPDRLPHEAGRAHLRALLRQRHGPDRRRGAGAHLLRASSRARSTCDVAVARWEAFTGKQARRE